MIAAHHLLVVCLLAQQPGVDAPGPQAARPDPAVLVAQLGAAKFADRQAAADALEQLGRDALPALREGRNSSDPEVKTRVQALLTLVEGRLLLEPTRVKLDFRDRPLAEVVDELTSRTGIPMKLLPENNQAFASRKITLEAPEPVTFWVMLERLCEVGSLQHATGVSVIPVQVAGRAPLGPVFALYDQPIPMAAPPKSIDGLFVTTAQSIRVHRDLNFGGIRGGGILRLNGNAPAAVAKAPVSNVQFSLDMTVQVEPRMIVSATGPARIEEAIDDLGQSLTPDASADVQRRMSGYFGGYGMAQANLSFQVQLQLPERSGQTIKRLKGALPVRVSSRKDSPVVIAIDQAKGKTIDAGDVRITIHDVRPGPDLDGSTQIELSARPSPDAMPDDPQNGMAASAMMFRSPQMAQSQMEILDARDQAYPQWLTTNMQVNNDEARLTIRLMANEQLGPPAKLRIYDLARANTELTFTFTDVPMP